MKAGSEKSPGCEHTNDEVTPPIVSFGEGLKFPHLDQSIVVIFASDVLNP